MLVDANIGQCDLSILDGDRAVVIDARTIGHSVQVGTGHDPAVILTRRVLAIKFCVGTLGSINMSVVELGTEGGGQCLLLSLLAPLRMITPVAPAGKAIEVEEAADPR